MASSSSTTPSDNLESALRWRCRLLNNTREPHFHLLCREFFKETAGLFIRHETIVIDDEFPYITHGGRLVAALEDYITGLAVYHQSPNLADGENGRMEDVLLWLCLWTEPLSEIHQLFGFPDTVKNRTAHHLLLAPTDRAWSAACLGLPDEAYLGHCWNLEDLHLLTQNGDAVVAGGSVLYAATRDSFPADVDIFVLRNNQQYLNNVVGPYLRALAARTDGTYEFVRSSAVVHITVKRGSDIQRLDIILTDERSVAELLLGFDLTYAMACWSHADGFRAHPLALHAWVTRTTFSRTPCATVSRNEQRAVKAASKGYTVVPDSPMLCRDFSRDVADHTEDSAVAAHRHGGIAFDPVTWSVAELLPLDVKYVTYPVDYLGQHEYLTPTTSGVVSRYIGVHFIPPLVTSRPYTQFEFTPTMLCHLRRVYSSLIASSTGIYGFNTHYSKCDSTAELDCRNENGGHECPFVAFDGMKQLPDRFINLHIPKAQCFLDILFRLPYILDRPTTVVPMSLGPHPEDGRIPGLLMSKWYNLSGKRRWPWCAPDVFHPYGWEASVADGLRDYLEDAGDLDLVMKFEHKQEMLVLLCVDTGGTVHYCRRGPDGILSQVVEIVMPSGDVTVIADSLSDYLNCKQHTQFIKG